MKMIFFTDEKLDLYLIDKFFGRAMEVFGKEKFLSLLRMYYPDSPENVNEIRKFFEGNVKEFTRKMDKDIEKLKSRWLAVEKEFFDQVPKITGFDWKFKDYKCHLSSTFVFGGCYHCDLGNVISIFPSAKHADPLETIFHEMGHLHFWEVLEKMGIETGNQKFVAEGKLWDLSEMSVGIILQGLKLQEYNYILESHIYPQHRNSWKKIKNFWKGDFKEFILKSVAFMEKQS